MGGDRAAASLSNAWILVHPGERRVHYSAARCAPATRSMSTFFLFVLEGPHAQLEGIQE